ncbi:MAG TPA: MbtH family protein [Phototrophicaceae bacterium]|jgi:MbtH protein|nr:MbtH family protein [Phototrophicaceae bacterium]
MENDQDDLTIYRVVMNHEEQYSLWLPDRDLPPGWTDTGKRGTKDECWAYMEQFWVDMRPLSLRQHMEEASRQNPPDEQS